MTALDLQSSAVREIVARLLSPDWDFVAATTKARAGGVVSTGDPTRDLLWVRLADIVGAHGAHDRDYNDALALFETARTVVPPAEWPQPDVLHYAHALWTAGRHDDLRDDSELLKSLSPRNRKFIEVDLEGARSGVGSPMWLARLNTALLHTGASPVALLESGDEFEPFDRLCPSEQRPVERDVLITVIMPSFRPGPEILTAVRSVLEQTWQNLELLIVDDASGSEYAATFARLASADERVRVLEQPTNRGTYAARNRALEEARGEFITFQDSDDWSHPERLERQVLPLLGDRRLLRSLSKAVRCTGDLILHSVGGGPVRANASSHLFHRSILDRVGRFDWVRKSADTEFDARLEAAFPGRRLLMGEALAFVRLQPGSLSRADFRPGWTHPARVEYRLAMDYWHDQISRGASPFMPREASKRPLTAPRPFLRGLVDAPDIDVAYMADWTQYGFAQRAALAEIRALVAGGTRVGILNVRSAMSSAPERAQLAIEARRLIADRIVTAVTLEEACQIPTLVVRQPEVLEWPTDRPVALDVGRIVVLAEDIPAFETPMDPFWTVHDCDKNAQVLFGVKPRWWVNGTDVRRVEEIVEPARIVTVPIPQIPARHAVAARWRTSGDRPVVGWIFEDVSSLPDSSSLMSVFPDDGSVDVRLLGPRDILKRVLGQIPPQWLVYDEREVSAGELWSQVDFAVGFPAQPRRQSAIRTAIEAQAAGCALVLDPTFCEVLGDAATYCEPRELLRTLEELGSARLGRDVQMDRDCSIQDLAALGASLLSVLR